MIYENGCNRINDTRHGVMLHNINDMHTKGEGDRMKHIIITTNDSESVAVMASYSGAMLIKSDSDFAVWYCTSLSQIDINALASGKTTVKLVGMLMLNVPN